MLMTEVPLWSHTMVVPLWVAMISEDRVMHWVDMEDHQMVGSVDYHQVLEWEVVSHMGWVAE